MEEISLKTILITGAAGFIGKNLLWTLQNDKEIEILTFDLADTQEKLEEYIEKADFVFHLAGINRPDKTEDFYNGNSYFTKNLLNLMSKSGKKASLLISSSIQATLDNDYGKSKKIAEDAVFNWGKETGNNVYIFRLPNVFGKWCRPNYNSVVATYCYNIARNLPIMVNNPDAMLSLVYIDDVIQAFLNAMDGNCLIDEEGYCKIQRVFDLSLQELSDRIKFIHDSRLQLVVTNYEDIFNKFLYATYTSYLPENEFGYDLEMKHDDRGWLAEFIKSSQFGQVFVSKTKPGITRGNHWHHTKVEKFLVVQGCATIFFRKIDSDNIIEYKVSGDKLRVLDIPAGYTHSITNTGTDEVITLFWSDERFNPQSPDTYYMEV